jgi:sterol 14-demethylase
LQHLTTPVFGKDVVYDVPNDLFMEQKRFVKVGLSSDNLRAYVGMIEEEVEDYLKSDPAFSVLQSNNVDEWGHFDVLEVLSGLTILTASRTLQGKEVRAGLDSTFAEIYKDLDGGFTPLNFLFPNLPLESYRKRDIAHKKISDFFSAIVRKRRAEVNPDVSGADFQLIPH